MGRLKRKVDSLLLQWKEDPEHKCLIVQGARQVGKTYSVRKFGMDQYAEMLEINFKETPQAAEIFKGDLKPDVIRMGLRFRYPDKLLPEGNTLLFLDEIQECPEAITALKFLSADRRMDVIASGSLLGIDYKRASSYPVGYVNYISMSGLDLEEFIQADGIALDMIDFLREAFEAGSPIPEAVHRVMMEKLREYMALGGMPEVVDTFLSRRDYVEADRVQRELLRGYQYDIAHYATAEEKVKAEKCFLTLAGQLLDKENHKFQYKEVEPGARAQKYYSSIEWLKRADMVQLCRKITEVRYDLDDYTEEGFFRVYPSDLSLLIPMKDFDIKRRIVEDDLQGNTRGGLYESVIADILHKKGLTLYFYKNETTRKELDFLVQKEGRIIPIEIKSRNNRATSLSAFLEKYSKDVDIAYKLADANMGTGEKGIVTAPLYMAMFL